MAPDGTRKVAELLGDERIGVVTTTSPEGTLTCRPMSTVDSGSWVSRSTGTPPAAGWPA